jgi:hypothetical protein
MLHALTPAVAQPPGRDRARSGPWWLLVLLSIPSLTGVVAAQEAPGSPYLHGGLTLPHQEGVSGEAAHQTYVAAPGGTTAGWIVGGGVFLTRRLSLEGEVASTGVMAARQPSRHGMTFNEERRDRFFSVNIRGHVGGSRRVHLEPVVGVTLVRGTAWSQTEYERLEPSGSTRIEVGPRIETSLGSRPALSGGLDVRIGGERFAIVPSFRVRVAGIGDEMVRAYPGGMSRWTFSPGIVGRVEF